jgi:glycosyltransferase involved in cell wall biosynthesis
VRFLACGTPVAVGGTNQFLEWPESAAPRITPGPPAPADIARVLAQAASGGAIWEERRRAARAAYEAGHRPEDTAREMIKFLEGLEP